jgi:hypothetical protein
MSKVDRTESDKERLSNRDASSVSTGNGRPATTGELAKVTLYVRPDQVVAIEAIQLNERMRTGRRRDKSSLVQEALDLLINKYKKSR